MALPFLVAKTSEIRNERIELGAGERCRVERTQVPPFVLEIALHAHRSEQEPAEVDAPKVAREAELEGACAIGRRWSRFNGAPRRRGGASRAVAHRESNALVRCVGKQRDDASLGSFDVDLNGVARAIAVEACAIALVRRRVVHSGFGEVEHRGRALRLARRRPGDQLGKERQEYDTHFRFLMRASWMTVSVPAWVRRRSGKR